MAFIRTSWLSPRCEPTYLHDALMERETKTYRFGVTSGLKQTIEFQIASHRPQRCGGARISVIAAHPMIEVNHSHDTVVRVGQRGGRRCCAKRLIR